MKKARKALSLFLTAAVFLTMLGAVGTSAATAEEESVGVSYETFGSRTMLESAGISYAVYMKWLEDHDPDGAYPDYYLGTPYVGYFAGTPFDGDDYRTPNGESYRAGDVPPAAAPYNGHGMNCTGFMWNVLVNAAERSGASQSAINALPAMSGNLTYWANHDIYRLRFSGTNCIRDALRSGVLEKGDAIWINGSDDWHTGFFYGDSPSDDRFWHSGAQNGISSVNRISAIESCGTPSELYVIKMIHPSRPPKIGRLAVKVSPKYSYVDGNPNYSLLGGKYCVFTSLDDAQAAASDYSSTAAWSKRVGTIAVNASGFGTLKTGACPGYDELAEQGSSHEYFKRSSQLMDITRKYFLVQQRAGMNYELDKTVYALNDARTVSDGFWKEHNLVRTASGLRYYVANAVNAYYASALRISVASASPELTDGNGDFSFEGARFAVYSDYQSALAAAEGSADGASGYQGQIIVNKLGVGWLRSGAAPSDEAMRDPVTAAQYHARQARPMLIGEYYAVQTVAAPGYQLSGKIYPFIKTGDSMQQSGFTELICSAACDGDTTVYQEPVTEEPTTEEPTTEEPATEEPATEEPTTEEPATEEPITEEPITEEPATEEPTTEEPATEEPTTEEPATGEPTEEPTTEEPATEEPTFEPRLFGDINGDGVMNINDATEFQRALADFRKPDGTLILDFKAPASLLYADIDGDGRLSISDVTALQRLLASR